MVTKTQIKGICVFLKNLVESRDAKLAFGNHQRTLIKNALKKGVTLDNYRTRWLTATRDKLINTLIESAEEFNTKYPHDRISMMDMADALETTLLRFGKR